MGAAIPDTPRKESIMQTAMNRRAFVAGASTAAVAALMGIGLDQARAEEVAIYLNNETPSFLEPAEPIEAAGSVDADIVVVGAGFSGLCCALSAAEAGASVILIERLDQVIGRGGSIFAMGSKLMDEKGYRYTVGDGPAESDGDKVMDIGQVYKRMLGYHSNHVDARKWMKHAKESREAMDWLIDHMTTASGVGGWDLTPVLEHHYVDPEGINGEYTGTHEFLDGPNGKGPDDNPQQDVCDNMLFYCQDRGVDVHFGTVAKQLVKDGDRVVGIICEDPDGTMTQYNGTKGVVMATGDFGANQEMMDVLVPWMRDIKGGIWEGSGHKMCYQVGAAIDRSLLPTVNMMCFQWRSISRQVRAFQGLYVNSDGERFVNEDNALCHGAGALMHEKGHECFAIWDIDYSNEPQWQNQRYVDGPKVFDTPEDVIAYWEEVMAGPGYIEMNGSGKIEVKMMKADTIEELVEMLGLPVETTLATIERYNKYCDQGFDEEFDKRAGLLLPVKNPPFYGIRCTPWFLTAHGGIRCNANMQIMDKDDVVIPGLYCVGSMVGDMYSNVYTTHFPGHNLGGCCLTFGYSTGKYIAAQ